MKKKILSMLLCFTLVICIIPQSSFAQSSRDTSFEQELALNLKALGLFKGVSDTNFDLNREPTRVEALVMLIRVLGKEAEALNSNIKHPFTDVPSWADKYVGYAYKNGLTKGTSATKFGTENANSAMYITFILRALGYSDASGKDFTWDNPYVLAKEIAILPTFVDTLNFLRADAVTVSYAALIANLKNSQMQLNESLQNQGVFNSASFIKNYDRNAISKKEAEIASSLKELSPKEIFNSCSPAVIYIETYDANDNPDAFGSGFFITSNGVAVTNFHVLEDAISATAKLGNNHYTVTGVLYFDEELDFAVIKTNATNVPYLNIGNSIDLYSGDEIYTIGNPQGLTNTISDGIISNPNREDFNGMIQITAPISPGSSGGALLNTYGEVIGITTASLTSGQNLNFAVPINEVVNKNELPTIETKYNMVTMEDFASANEYNNNKIEPPKNIRVVKQQNSSAYIQWDEVEGAEYYHFYYQEDSEEDFWYGVDDNEEKLKIEYDDDYSVLFNQLDNGKKYNIIVTSVKNGVESEDSEIFSFIFGSSSSQVTAFNALKNFILLNSNDEINGKPMYKELYKIGDGLRQFELDYDAKKNLITLCVLCADGYSYYTYIELTPDKNYCFSSLSYYTASNKTNNPTFRGSFYINSNNYGLNSKISFIKTEGATYDTDIFGELALASSLGTLDFADYIFKTYLSDKNVSLSDFGFNVPRNGYTTATFGNPINW